MQRNNLCDKNRRSGEYPGVSKTSDSTANDEGNRVWCTRADEGSDLKNHNRDKKNILGGIKRENSTPEELGGGAGD